MTWLAFFASIIGSLAWPVAIFAIVFLFRGPILARVPGLSEIEYGKFKLKFEKQLSDALTNATQLNLPSTDKPTQYRLKAETGHFMVTGNDVALYASIAPVGLVLQSWVPVEGAIESLASRVGVDTRPPLAWRELTKRGLIPESLITMIDKLRRMRNEAAHHSAFAIDPEQALEYADLAKRAAAALNAIEPTKPK